MKNDKNLLVRAFGMKEATTITVGTVIGVGLFTVGANVVGMMGSTVIWATLTALLISVYPALLYAEMGSALPYAGGTYKYASLGINKPIGMLAGWNFVISLISVSGGEALAFSYYFKTIFLAFGIEIPVSDVFIACLVVAVFLYLNIRGIELVGKMQNAFMFFFWGVAIIWFLTTIPNINLPNFVRKPDFIDLNPQNFLSNVALIWWCFAGFETCCAMGEEIKYPQINIPRALFLAPFIVFIVNALFQWFLIGIVDTQNLEALSVSLTPYADAMITAGILGLPLALLSIGIAFGGDFSTLNASLSAPPRYLFTMSRDGVLPAFLSKVHPVYKTPYTSILAVGILTLLFIASNSLSYIASLSLFGDLIYYVIGIISAIGLRKKMPDLNRPFKAPFLIVGATISAIIYIFMLFQLESSAIITGIVWSILGLIIYCMCIKKYGSQDVNNLDYYIMNIEEPSKDELISMDKEFNLWRNIIVILLILVGVLYLMPHF